MRASAVGINHRSKLARVDSHSLHRLRFDELSREQLYGLLKLRTDVFFVEQKVDETELDWRDAEPTTVHHFIETDGRIVAYLRVLVDDEAEYADARRLIGRVVVHADHRGRGLAQRLIAGVVEAHGDEALLLHAQTYILPLYAGFGFEPVGEEYVEAGIPHRTMYRRGVALGDSQAPRI